MEERRKLCRKCRRTRAELTLRWEDDFGRVVEEDWCSRCAALQPDAVRMRALWPSRPVTKIRPLQKTY